MKQESADTTSWPIIPVGFDCHPAYVLRALQLREQSFPFDWLNTKASTGFHYVNCNIRSRFADCLDELTTNVYGKVISARYPETEFTHFDDLIENVKLRQTLARRAERFLEMFQRRNCLFLCAVSSLGLQNAEEVRELVAAAHEFHELSGGRHRLLVYVRFNESFQENEEICRQLTFELNRIPNVTVAHYIRGLSQFGIWGNPAGYTALLSSLGIQIAGRKRTATLTQR
jgi:hypothetical protein